MFPALPSAHTLILFLEKYEITDVVISPGSRNAPLAIGFASNESFNCYSIIDERSAGFFAIGIAQQKQNPVVLLCTSGSAVVNYYPAVSEAYYSEIPLIILSAVSFKPIAFKTLESLLFFSTLPFTKLSL